MKYSSLFLSLFAFIALAACAQTGTPDNTASSSLPAAEDDIAMGSGTYVAAGCQVGGCSSQLCGNEGDEMMSTCEFRPEYACYAIGRCEKQTDGNCGWTPSEELTICLEEAAKIESGTGALL